MKLDKNQRAFLALLKAGLWEKKARLLSSDGVDFACVYKLAQGQSVAGLVAAGLERAADFKVPQADALALGSFVLQLEHRNKAMNLFIAELITKLKSADIYAVLEKGQGIAQCYERPLWRACGDVDLFLSGYNYVKAKDLLTPLATHIDDENEYRKHLELIIGKWCVELHGNLRSGFSRRVDRGLDYIEQDIIANGKVRSWQNGDVEVPLPSADNDVIIIFTHILQHFFLGGIGLRQICDWCRLLWKFAGEIDVCLLERRLRSMGLIPEWRVFAALAVDYLDMPVEALPFYVDSPRNHRRAARVMALVLDSGNFGRNRLDFHKQEDSANKKHLLSFWWYTRYAYRQFGIFPFEAVKGWLRLLFMGTRAAVMRALKR